MRNKRTATILIPAHCSSLPNANERVERCVHGLPSELAFTRSSSNEKDVIDGTPVQNRELPANKRLRRHHASSSPAASCSVLAIQCHRDGVAWKGLHPILFFGGEVSASGDGERGDGSAWPNSCGTHATARAISVLLSSFGCFVRQMEIFPPAEGGTNGDDTTLGVDKHSPDEKHGENLIDDNMIDTTLQSDTLWHGREVKFGYWSRCGKERPKKGRLVLLVLPPYPGHSAPPSLRPEQLFSCKLVKLENLFLRLQTLNAFFSTLGGGYFLCRYLTTAVRLARSQRAVALAMGDQDLAARCTVNEAYNYIHAGKIAHALALIKEVKAAAVKRGDDLTVSMCKSARLFAKRVGRACVYEGGRQSVGDDLQRIRIVKDKDKIEKTFRPCREISDSCD